MKIITTALTGYGYALGHNLEFRSYGADAHIGRLPQLAKEIAATGADAVVVLGWPPANAMKAAGIPTVVAVGAGDPVATGLVASLARPGGNVTGISDNATTLSTKRLELLKQTKPNIRKVAMLWNKDDLDLPFEEPTHYLFVVPRTVNASSVTYVPLFIARALTGEV
jgi:putative ABC transport system substrate-binding protein